MGADEDLCEAIKSFSVEAAKAALAAGADPNSYKGHGIFRSSVLHWAISRLDTEFVRMVVDGGATLDMLARGKILLLKWLKEPPKTEEAKEIWTAQLSIIEAKLAAAENEGQMFVGLLEVGKMENSDVKFVWDDGSTLQAHKEKLAAASPFYFAAALSERWEQSNPDGVFKPNYSVAAIKAVLSFVYTGGLPPLQNLMEEDHTGMFLVETFAAAHEYQIPGLEALALCHLEYSLSCATLKEHLLQGHLLGLSDLKKVCFDFVSKNWKAILFRDIELFTSIKEEHPELWKEMAKAIDG